MPDDYSKSPFSRVALVPLEARPADVNAAAVYLARLAQRSRRVQGQAIAVLAELLAPGAPPRSIPWGALRYEHTQALRAGVAAAGYAPSTANRILAALRGVLKEAWRLGQVDAEVYQRAADLEPIKGTRPPAGRRLSDAEIASFLAACWDFTTAGARDGAAFALGCFGGLRRMEIASLEVSDYDCHSGDVQVRAGKGNKARLVPSPAAHGAVEHWLVLRGDAPGPLITAVSAQGEVRLRHVTDQAITLMLKRRATAAGISRFSPHDMRRTFISSLLERGADLATVQALAGHSNVNTTARYDRRGQDAMRKAAALLTR